MPVAMFHALAIPFVVLTPSIPHLWRRRCLTSGSGGGSGTDDRLPLGSLSPLLSPAGQPVDALIA